VTVKSRENWMSFEAEDLANELMQLHTLKCSVASNPVYSMVIRNQYAYYSTMLDQNSWMTSLNFQGEQGELVKMSVPQSRTLVRQLLTLLCKQKLAFKSIAKVKDSEVQEKVRIGDAVAADVVQSQDLDILAENMVESCLVAGTSFIKTTWRSDFGEPKVVKTEEDGKETVIYDGDIEITVPDFFDLTYNYTITKWKDLDWVECRVRRNRWSLIAQHPELEVDILKLPSVDEDDYTRTFQSVDNRDMVYVYEMYHRPTPALPLGRMLVYASPKCIFVDEINRYGCIPIEQYKPEPIEGIGYGYAMLSNLLPAQEMYDHSMSCLATNQSALGVQNVLNPRGSDINVRELSGMNFVDYTPQPIPGGGEPKKLDLLSSAPELFKFPEVLLANMQQMSYINAAVRGELASSTSGVAIATLTTNALEFLSSYTKNLQSVLEKTVMHSINAYRRFAKTERLVKMTGKNHQSFMKPFEASDLEPIQGIQMTSVNPLMQTIAGRIDISEKALDKGLVKDLQSYVSILDGAPLSQLFEVELSQNDLIQQENERFLEDMDNMVLSTDLHPQHIMKHVTLLNDPQVRFNSPLVGKIQEHILEHLRLQRETDPMLMAMAATGRVPEMPPQGAGGPPMPPPPPPMEGDGSEQLDDQSNQPMIKRSGMDLPTAEVAEPADDLLGRN
jgi:hypothetical protein